jgi:hypothetical protein
MLAVALILALSVTVMAVMPQSAAAQIVRGQHQLGLIKSFDPKPVLNPPECPYPIPPGC